MSESTEQDLPRYAWKEAIKRRVVRMCSAGLVGGSPQAEYLERLGMPADRIFTGYDVVDNDHFAAGAIRVRRQAELFRRQFGLPDHFFLASARFIPRKNLRRLLCAFKTYLTRFNPGPECQAAATTEPWSLVVLGDGPERKRLEQLIVRSGLGDFVQLPGFKQYAELPVYYGLSGAFIHPSTSEPWGLVVNEAMACALPVLVSERCGCARDLVGNDHNGFTFDPYDEEQLAGLMLRVSTSEQEASRWGNASARLIAGWGLRRFRFGLHQAARCALASSCSGNGFCDQLFLRCLAIG
jgi:glycosyltransferase involved in cell wall biosynthesis